MIPVPALQACRELVGVVREKVVPGLGAWVGCWAWVLQVLLPLSVQLSLDFAFFGCLHTRNHSLVRLIVSLRRVAPPDNRINFISSILYVKIRFQRTFSASSFLASSLGGSLLAWASSTGSDWVSSAWTWF